MAKIRGKVGEQPPLTIDIPSHLSAVKELLAKGRVPVAIHELQTQHADDPATWLVLAPCLAFVERYAEALDVYAKLRDTEHRRVAIVGRARILLDLSRATEAHDELAEVPSDDADTIALRARTFEQLGRLDDADALYRKLETSFEGRSNALLRSR